MASIKPEKTPSLIGVYLVGLISVWFGALLGFIYLTTFPAQAFGNMREYEAALAEADAPEIAKPGDHIYIEGPTLATRSWESKRKLLNESGPQTISISTGEMNAWVSSRFSAPLPTSDLKDSKLVVIPGIPNFAIAEGRDFYINLPLSIYISGTRYSCVLTALGDVTKDGFEPRTVSLNSAMLPFPGILGARVMESLAQAFQSTEDYKIVVEALDRAESVSVEQSALVLSLR